MSGHTNEHIEQVLASGISQLMNELIIVLVLMVILSLAAVFDYRERRIPNFLSLSGWFVGPLLYSVMYGFSSIGLSLLGLLIVLFLTVPLWLLGVFGAGDVKLIGTVGALVGSANIFSVLLGITVAGMLYALGTLVYKLAINGSRTSMGLGGTKSEVVNEREVNESLPYAVPIAFGTLVSLLVMTK